MREKEKQAQQEKERKKGGKAKTVFMREFDRKEHKRCKKRSPKGEEAFKGLDAYFFF